MFSRQISRKLCESSSSTMSYLSAEYLTSPNTIHEFMKKIQSLQKYKFPQKIEERKAAVLIPFCQHDNGRMSLLYTLRSSQLKSHAGHVAFPGGKFDSTDVSLVDTALRETEEELGISRDVVEVWGEFMTLPSKNFEMAVTPIVGLIRNFDHVTLKPSEFEVDEVFLVSLEKLCDEQYFGFDHFKNGYSVPYFTGGNHKIWGLTAIFTHLILSCLLPEKVYPMHSKHVGFPPAKL